MQSLRGLVTTLGKHLNHQPSVCGHRFILNVLFKWTVWIYFRCLVSHDQWCLLDLASVVVEEKEEEQEEEENRGQQEAAKNNPSLKGEC